MRAGRSTPEVSTAGLHSRRRKLSRFSGPPFGAGEQEPVESRAAACRAPRARGPVSGTCAEAVLCLPAGDDHGVDGSSARRARRRRARSMAGRPRAFRRRATSVTEPPTGTSATGAATSLSLGAGRRAERLGRFPRSGPPGPPSPDVPPDGSPPLDARRPAEAGRRATRQSLRDHGGR